MRYLVIASLLAIGCVTAEDHASEPSSDMGTEVRGDSDAGMLSIDVGRLSDNWPACQNAEQWTLQPCEPLSNGSRVLCYSPASKSFFAACIITPFTPGQVEQSHRCERTCDDTF